MFSYRIVVVAIAILLSRLSVAQTKVLTFDPNSVSIITRAIWCGSQLSTCLTICRNDVLQNDCDPITLDNRCECKDYSTPDLTRYNATMESLICRESHCPNAGDDDKQATCYENIGDQCPTTDPHDFEPPIIYPTLSSKSTSVSRSSSTIRNPITTSRITSTSTTSSSSGTTDTTIQTLQTSISFQPRLSVSTLSESTTFQDLSGPTQSSFTLGEVKRISGNLIGMYVGIVLAVIGASGFIGWLIWKEKARGKKKKEADQRSIRSRRGSVLMMSEMSAGNIHETAQLESEEKPGEFPGEGGWSHGGEKQGEVNEQSNMLEHGGGTPGTAELPGSRPPGPNIYELE